MVTGQKLDRLAHRIGKQYPDRHGRLSLLGGEESLHRTEQSVDETDRLLTDRNPAQLHRRVYGRIIRYPAHRDQLVQREPQNLTHAPITRRAPTREVCDEMIVATTPLQGALDQFS